MYDKAYHNRILARQLRGWTLEEATRSIEKEVFELEGAKLSLEEWCILLGLHTEDTYFRIIRGHKLKDIVKEKHE
jgi:hypothetical protein